MVILMENIKKKALIIILSFMILTVCITLNIPICRSFSFKADALSSSGVNDINITLDSKVNLLDEKGASTVITSSVSCANGGLDGITFAYSITEGQKYIALTDNGDGTATITSLTEGISRIEYKASTGESGDFYIMNEYHKLPDYVPNQSVVDMTIHSFEGNHLNSYYDVKEQAYKFIADPKIVQSDDGKGNIVYYTSGFMRFTKHGRVDSKIYKYLLLTIKAENTASFQIRYNDGYGWKTVAQGSPSFDATDGEYVTYAVNMQEGTNSSTFIEFVVGIYGESPVYIKDIRFSDIPTLNVEKDEVRRVKIVSADKFITQEGGKAKAKAVLFCNKKTDRSLIWKVSESSKASVTYFDGGNDVEITAINNGDVTVMACDKLDNDNCDSVTLSISNQREKFAVYDMRIVFWGASVTKHGPSTALDWHGNWGMAATSEDKDYVHRIVARLEEELYPSKVTYDIVATGSQYDASISKDTKVDTDYTSHSSYRDVQRSVSELKPNIFLSAQTGNLRSTSQEDCVYNAYSQLYDMVFDVVPDCIVLSEYCQLAHMTMVEKVHSRLSQRYAADSSKTFLLDHSKLVGNPQYFASEWAEKDPPQHGVAAHWNDAGMDEVARVEVEMLIPYIRTNIQPTFIYFPERLEITGSKSITSSGGSTALSAKVYPLDSSNEVIWSVDDKKVATINKSGVLTAVNNGTVTVRAESKYNSEVFATFDVSISGQPDSYSVTYDANTTDQVIGMPENDNYIRGNHILSEKRPLRDCYTFAGWALTKNSTEVVTVVENVNSNTTVYAVWEKTEGFEFEGEYDEHFGYTYGFDIEGGFHAEVTDGRMSSICTGGEKVRFISPVLDIDNRGIMSFRLESAYFDDNSRIVLTVNNGSISKIFVYPYSTMKAVTYVADISELGEKITGFDIFVDAVPENSSMFPIALDYVRIGKDRKIDAEKGSFSVITDGYVISNMETADALKKEFEITDKNNVIITDGDGFDITVQDVEESMVLYITCNNETQSLLSITAKNFGENGRFQPAVTKVYACKDGEFYEDGMVSGVITAYDKGSIRTSAPMGMRVMASVTNELHNFDEVEEYGFIVTNTRFFDLGLIDELVYNTEVISKGQIVVGKAYCKEEGIHKIYELSDGLEYYTAVLTNIPKDKYSLMTPLMFRPYVKLTGGQYVYGAKTVRSACEIAKDIMDVGTADKQVSYAASEILDICGVDYKEDTYIDMGALWDRK